MFNKAEQTISQVVRGTLFTDDMNKLTPQLSADVSKTSAVEVSQTPSIAQGIGMGI
jgi:hypothetical protein